MNEAVQDLCNRTNYIYKKTEVKNNVIEHTFLRHYPQQDRVHYHYFIETICDYCGQVYMKRKYMSASRHVVCSNKHYGNRHKKVVTQ